MSGRVGLREQGCQVAARTYRAWRSQRPAARTFSDALVAEAIREVARTRPPGTGKTHLAVALGIKAAEAAFPVAFDYATA